MTAMKSFARSARRPAQTAAVLALCFCAAATLSLSLASIGYALA
jgi:hypothetical protein